MAYHNYRYSAYRRRFYQNWWMYRKIKYHRYTFRMERRLSNVKDKIKHVIDKVTNTRYRQIEKHIVEEFRRDLNE